jgi:hypothetical protein
MRHRPRGVREPQVKNHCFRLFELKIFSIGPYIHFCNIGMSQNVVVILVLTYSLMLFVNILVVICSLHFLMKENIKNYYLFSWFNWLCNSMFLEYNDNLLFWFSL